MKKLWLAAGVFSVLLFALTACGSTDPQDELSKELGLDVSGGIERTAFDTHSGNGDGVSCAALEFSDEKIVQEIQADPSWKSFPLDETAQALVYGISDETSSVGPFLTDDAGDPVVPEIKNGYYRLIDRQTDAEDGQDILDRYSFNLTLALYDTDSSTLYFCKLDT